MRTMSALRSQKCVYVCVCNEFRARDEVATDYDLQTKKWKNIRVITDDAALARLCTRINVEKILQKKGKT